MSEETEVTETPEVTGNEEVVEGQVESSLIFGKYKTIEEAEKGYKAAERLISRQGQTLSERETKLKDLEDKANLTRAIESLAAKSKQETQPTNEDYDKFISQLGEEFQSNPAEATKKLVGMTGSWLSDVERKTTKYSDDKVSVLEGRLANIQSMLEKLDPAYVKDKELIDELVDGGMSQAAAKKFVAKLDSPDAPVQRSRPPLSPTGNRQGSAPVQYFTAKDRAEAKAEGLSDEDIANLEAEYKTNYELELKRKRSKNE